MPQKRFERKTALRVFDRAVFADEAFVIGAVDADDRPERLGAGHAAWIAAARRIGGEGADVVVHRRRPFERMHGHLA